MPVESHISIQTNIRTYVIVKHMWYIMLVPCNESFNVFVYQSRVRVDYFSGRLTVSVHDEDHYHISIHHDQIHTFSNKYIKSYFKPAMQVPISFW